MMKLCPNAILLFSFVAPIAAFLRPTENLPSSVGSSSGSRSAQGMTSHGIDPSYLQTELANFCNQKLVGGSLVSSFLSSDSSTSSMLVADGDSPMTTIHEKAMDWFHLGSAAISQSFLEFPSSFLSSALSDVSAALDPNHIVPSMIMLTTMTMTVVVSSRSKSKDQTPLSTMTEAASSHTDTINKAAEAIFPTTSTKPALPEVSSFTEMATPHNQIFFEEAPSNPTLVMSSVEEKIESSPLLATETSETEIIVTTDFAIETKPYLASLEGSISCVQRPSDIPGATTVIARNLQTAFQGETIENATRTKSSTADVIILKVARWFFNNLRHFRIYTATQSMVPLWRARYGEEAQIHKEMVAKTKVSWQKAIATIVQFPWYRRIKSIWTRPGRQSTI